MSKIYEGEFTCKSKEGKWVSEKICTCARNKSEAVYWMIRLLLDKYEINNILPCFKIQIEKNSIDC